MPRSPSAPTTPTSSTLLQYSRSAASAYIPARAAPRTTPGPESQFFFCPRQTGQETVRTALETSSAVLSIPSRKKASQSSHAPSRAHPLQQVVVVLAMGLEKKAQIQQRLAQGFFLAEQQRNQKPPQPAVAVEKRMDRFKLNVDQSQLHQQRQRFAVVVQELLERIETLHQPVRWRRNERRITRPRAADPVLRAPEFTRSLVRSTAASKQNRMHLANQSQRKRKPVAQAPQPVLHGRHIVRNFLHIIDGHARSGAVFKKQQLRKRRLRALDLRGQHGFFANVGIQQKIAYQEARLDRPSRRPTARSARSMRP